MFFYVVFLSVGGWARSAGAACGRARSRCWVAVGRALKNRLDSPASLCSGGNRSSRWSQVEALREESPTNGCRCASQLLDVALEVAQALALVGAHRGAVRSPGRLAAPTGERSPVEIRFLRHRADRGPLQMEISAQELPLNPGRSPALRNSQPPHLRRSWPHFKPAQSAPESRFCT